MRRKKFMATVLSIVLAWGLLGQAASAKVIAPSPFEPAPDSLLTFHPVPVGDKGGVPNLCSYSSIISIYYTFRCATDIEYSPSGFKVTESRSFNLNLYKNDIYKLRSYIDEFAKNFSYYRAELDQFLKDWNMTSVTWDELNNYAMTRSKIGSDASKVLTEWRFLEADLEEINFYIDAWFF